MGMIHPSPSTGGNKPTLFPKEFADGFPNATASPGHKNEGFYVSHPFIHLLKSLGEFHGTEKKTIPNKT
jgi:hypothetical protein